MTKLKLGYIGTGTCFEQLKEEYGDTNVKIYGKYNGIKQSREIYKNTDILYCCYNPDIPNWKNAYPTKLFETIITETPIIVSKNTKAEEFVIENKIGEAINYGDTELIEKSINTIYLNYKTYVDNLKKIKNCYEWKTISKNLDIIYNGNRIKEDE